MLNRDFFFLLSEYTRGKILALILHVVISIKGFWTNLSIILQFNIGNFVLKFEVSSFEEKMSIRWKWKEIVMYREVKMSVHVYVCESVYVWRTDN